MSCRGLALFALFALSAGCGEALPEDIEGYRERCIRLNEQPIAVTNDDPHEGVKNVYACDIDCSAINQRPLPDGTLIVKESQRADSDFVWLIATARKTGSDWQWDEYTRNFSNESFLSVAVSEEVCVDCHKKWKADDWISTYLDDESSCP